jgi:hypothetical protein
LFSNVSVDFSRAMGATKREVKLMIASRIGVIAAATIELGSTAAPANAAEILSIKSSLPMAK